MPFSGTLTPEHHSHRHLRLSAGSACRYAWFQSNCIVCWTSVLHCMKVPYRILHAACNCAPVLHWLWVRVCRCAVTDRCNESGQEKPVLMSQAAFKRPSRQSDAHQSPRQSLEWDKVKPEDKTLVHQVRFITWDFFCYCFCSHLRCTLRPTATTVIMVR